MSCGSVCVPVDLLMITLEKQWRNNASRHREEALQGVSEARVCGLTVAFTLQHVCLQSPFFKGHGSKNTGRVCVCVCVEIVKGRVLFQQCLPPHLPINALPPSELVGCQGNGSSCFFCCCCCCCRQHPIALTLPETSTRRVAQDQQGPSGEG